MYLCVCVCVLMCVCSVFVCVTCIIYYATTRIQQKNIHSTQKVWSTCSGDSLVGDTLNCDNVIDISGGVLYTS